MNSAEILRRRFLQALGLTSLGVAVGAFVADHAPDAHHKLVNRLLDSKLENDSGSAELILSPRPLCLRGSNETVLWNRRVTEAAEKTNSNDPVSFNVVAIPFHKHEVP